MTRSVGVSGRVRGYRIIVTMMRELSIENRGLHPSFYPFIIAEHVIIVHSYMRVKLAATVLALAVLLW